MLALVFNRELHGNLLFFVVTLEAGGFYLVARKLRDEIIDLASYVGYAMMGFWLFNRLGNLPAAGTAMLNYQALVDLALISSGLAIAWFARKTVERRVYLLASFVALAGLFVRELDDSLLFLVLTLETATFFLVARRLKDEVIDGCSHAAFIGMAGWLGYRLLDLRPEGTAVFNFQALAHLSLIVMGLAIAWFNRNVSELRTYLLISFAALAGLLWHQFDGNSLMLALTIEAVALHVIAWWQSDRVVTGGAHVMVGLVGLWLLDRLMSSRIADTAVFNATALTDMFMIVAALVVTFLFITSTEKLVYRLAAHAAILVWFARELSPLENGQGFVTVAWGVYAALLLIAGLRLDYTRMRQAALATLLLVVAKLFLVDLARIATIWRVILFVGFGGVFLALSYYFPKLWKGKTDTDKPSAP